ncbi:MAG: phosphodiester glycosidase family protein [Lachnospiraceae bacterium]|nr:phosphodiester glycosidase family protein [Lachnospiraceae bacterium]
MLDTFVIARPVTAVSQAAVPEAAGAETAEEPAEEAASGTENESEADTESDAAAEEESSESSRKHRKKPGEKGKGGKKRKEDSDSSSEAGRDTADNADTEAGDPADDSDTASNADSADDADSTDGADSADSAQTAGIGTVMTETSYSDDNMDIELSAYREYDTTIYVAEVSADSAYLKTAFANGTYGKNVTAKTSEIAGSTGAILAINGDFYGTQEKGYVVRDGVVYRDIAKNGQEDLVIYSDGSFGFINEGEVTAQELVDAGAEQVLSFGPALVTDGQISVSEGEEVGKAMASNPRTAIAQTADGKYLFIVADGRTSESAGVSLSQLAQFLQSIGAVNAYNLDGGGSSTMVFNGTVVNNPTTGGRIKERSVSDIVYIGY